MNIKRDIELLYEIGCIRFIQRVWSQMLGPKVANLAEHHFRIALLALILARHEGVKNEEKVLKMALIHDLAESRTGDVHYISRLYTQRNEEKAIEDMFKDTSLAHEMIDLWKEYEKKESKAAQIVKDADNLDIDLELKEQEARGHKFREALGSTRQQVVQKKLFTDSAKKIWEAIQTSNPNDWHINAPNRFNSGDWKK